MSRVRKISMAAAGVAALAAAAGGGWYLGQRRPAGGVPDTQQAVMYTLSCQVPGEASPRILGRSYHRGAMMALERQATVEGKVPGDARCAIEEAVATLSTAPRQPTRR